MTNLFLNNSMFDLVTINTLASLQYTKLAMYVIPSFMAVLPGLVALAMGLFMKLIDALRNSTQNEYDNYQKEMQMAVPPKVTAGQLMQPVKLLTSGPDFGMFDKNNPWRDEESQPQILPAILVVVEEEPDMLPYIEEEGIEEGGLLAYCELFIKSDSKFNGQMLPA